ncbi:VirB3 family type IV secretion system protein [Phaeobacter sp. J2-8]|nr:VirB3 family type IV secretion system protein [Phaeobacter sp. J2-8]MCJ7874765.1 VirB3 family type IV secretion system protein [Phaeobacter sp. J2-8]
MADQSRVFIGLLRPPKLMGLPIMYAMVWLFGSTLLFLWVQSWVVAVFAGLAWPRSGRPQTGIRTSSMSW